MDLIMTLLAPLRRLPWRHQLLAVVVVLAMIGPLAAYTLLAAKNFVHPSMNAASPVAEELIAELTVAPAASLADFDRAARFGRWTDADRNGCNTRTEILQRDGSLVDVDDACRVAAGAWNDPYSGRLLPGRAYVEVDHIVSPAEAWRSGAKGWTQKRRIAFANDPLNLIAVDADVRADKAGRDAAQWLPPKSEVRASYAERYVQVKAKWGLSVDERERAVLAQVAGA